jgi:cold shock protein
VATVLAWPPLERTVRTACVREEEIVHMATGTVKKVVADRGFGFITAQDGKEYFFHRSGLQSSLDFDRLVGGESVTFETERGPKGDRAVRVQAAE